MKLYRVKKKRNTCLYAKPYKGFYVWIYIRVSCCYDEFIQVELHLTESTLKLLKYTVIVYKRLNCLFKRENKYRLYLDNGIVPYNVIR